MNTMTPTRPADAPAAPRQRRRTRPGV